MRIELMTLGLLDPRSNHLSYTSFSEVLCELFFCLCPLCD